MVDEERLQAIKKNLMDFVVILNLVALAIFIPAVIHFRSCLMTRSGIVLSFVFLLVACLLLLWALFIDYALLIGYKG